MLISVSSLSYRAKAVGVHKCNGAGNMTILSMFLWETAIIILFALILMGLILMNFQDFFEDTAAVKLSALFGLDRIWVPLLTVAVLFVVGGVLPGRLFARIPVTQVFRRYTEGKGLETTAVVYPVCRCSIYLRTDVCGDDAILLYLE